MNMTQTKKNILSLAFFALTTCFSQNAKASQIYEFDWQFDKLEGFVHPTERTGNQACYWPQI